MKKIIAIDQLNHFGFVFNTQVHIRIFSEKGYIQSEKNNKDVDFNLLDYSTPSAVDAIDQGLR